MLELDQIFDESYYISQNADVAQAVARRDFRSGLSHFREYGQFEKRNPSAFFDTSYYLRQNPDVGVAVERGEITALQHFLRFGQIEGRNPNNFFNTSYYLLQNSDVAEAVRRSAQTADPLTGIEHFIEFGQFEGRSFSANFNSATYLQQNPDVAEAIARTAGTRDPLTGIEHFLNFGQEEGRRGGHVGNVIFIHPDGAGPSIWGATRILNASADGRLNWDMMSNAGTYVGTMADQLTGTSNAGAVTHAIGVKVHSESYGLDAQNRPLTSLSGKQGLTILDEARLAGKATAVINSGFIAEPGTGAFLGKVAPGPGQQFPRQNVQAITAQVVDARPTVIMGGGERDMLPTGVVGRFGQAGTRTDGRNLIAEAQTAGYTVVYNRDELLGLLNPNRPGGVPQRVLGVFAFTNTYDDRSEEALGLNTANPSPLYRAGTPTVAEMLEVTLRVVSQDPDGFMVVLEEEGTDNFGNANNAVGTLTAAKRADDAIGVAMRYIDRNPNTLLVTAADSEAGGLQIWEPFLAGNNPLPATSATVPTIANNTGPTPALNIRVDGLTGSTAAAPDAPGITGPWRAFTSAPDRNGRRYNFGIAWVGGPDFPGAITAKAHGLNARLLPTTVDNTDVYKIMYETLFGTRLSGNTGF